MYKEKVYFLKKKWFSVTKYVHGSISVLEIFFIDIRQSLSLCNRLSAQGNPIDVKYEVLFYCFVHKQYLINNKQYK